MIEDIEELFLGIFRDTTVQTNDFFLDDIFERGQLFRFDVCIHPRTRTLFHARKLIEHELLLLSSFHVVPDHRAEHGRNFLRRVRQGRVWASRDAFHALRAVLRNVERRFTACDILGSRGSGACSHHTDRSQRSGRLMIPETVPILAVKLCQGL